ncbi:MAG: hypothetical protein ABI551_20925 [Polyangiaceae bacterium]
MTPRRFRTLSGLQSFLYSRPAQAWHVTKEHDDACTPSVCQCSPTFLVRELSADAVIAGEAGEAAWRKAVSS